MRISSAAILLAVAGCAQHPEVELAWKFEARPTHGEVRVLPVVGTWDDPEVRTDTWLGAIGDAQVAVRSTRTAELSRVPAAVAVSLPGAVNRRLGTSSEAEFRPGHYPPGGRTRLQAALRGRGDLDATLGDVGRNGGGDAVLITWVTALDGDPLSAEGCPGDIIETASGPVMVDDAEEPYRVTALVGMALVSADGEVVIRYSDEFEAILSRHNDPDRVGRRLAMALADEVVKVWPDDPRLDRGEPKLARR